MKYLKLHAAVEPGKTRLVTVFVGRVEAMPDAMITVDGINRNNMLPNARAVALVNHARECGALSIVFDIAGGLEWPLFVTEKYEDINNMLDVLDWSES